MPCFSKAVWKAQWFIYGMASTLFFCVILVKIPRIQPKASFQIIVSHFKCVLNMFFCFVLFSKGCHYVYMWNMFNVFVVVSNESSSGCWNTWRTVNTSQISSLEKKRLRCISDNKVQHIVCIQFELLCLHPIRNIFALYPAINQLYVFTHVINFHFS